MYKGTSKNSTNRAAGLNIKNLQGGEVILTSTDERLSLVTKKNKLIEEVKIINALLKKHPRDRSLQLKRKELGLILKEVDDKIHEIRPKKKAPGVEHYFIEATRETVTKAQFHIIMTNAVKKMREQEEKNEEE
jgi:hypothetical protein